MGTRIDKLKFFFTSSFLLSLCVVSFFLYSAAAQNSKSTDTSSPSESVSGVPKANIPVGTFDFGTVKQGSSVTQAFTIENNGTGLLKILDVQADCGCTVAEPESREIEAGSSANVNVIFDTSGFRGYKVKTVRIYTNDPEENLVSFSLKGNIQRDIELEPARLYFGIVRRGESKTIKVKFQKYSTDEIKIVDVVSRSEALKVNMSENGFDVSLDPTVPFGIFRDRVVVKTTSKETPVIHVPVFARVHGDIVSKPGDVSFGLLEGPLQEKIQREVTITNTSGRKLKVLNIESDTKGLKAELLEDEIAETAVLTVSLEPGISGVFHSKIQISTDHPDPEQSNFSLPVYGIVAKKGK